MGSGSVGIEWTPARTLPPVRHFHISPMLEACLYESRVGNFECGRAKHFFFPRGDEDFAASGLDAFAGAPDVPPNCFGLSQAVRSSQLPVERFLRRGLGLALPAHVHCHPSYRTLQRPVRSLRHLEESRQGRFAHGGTVEGPSWGLAGLAGARPGNTHRRRSASPTICCRSGRVGDRNSACSWNT